MTDQMTTGQRLVLNFAQREEASLSKMRTKREAKGFKAVAEALWAERFHSRLSCNDCNGIPKFRSPNESPSAIIARTMIENSLTSRDLAARMEGCPLRNLMLLRLLFAGGAIVGGVLESRIADALERRT